MGHNPSCYRSNRPEDLERPVEQVSWDECQVFLHGLNVKVRGFTARLPTEAEWERACRAGRTGTTWERELSDAKMPLQGFLEAFLNAPLFPKPYPVTRSAPNPFGLHDMLGNVWEWCADEPRCYTFDPVTDPAHIGHDQDRVGRGGSTAIKGRSAFSLPPSQFARPSLNRPRAAYRLRRSRAFRNHGVGFRLAAS
jgi:formylglycine-generating enzyme required for sulfatase activity